MTNSVLSVTFTGVDPALAGTDLSRRVSIVQEPIPENSKSAQFGDLAPMRNNAALGITAQKVIYDSCPYATLEKGVLKIKLRFFVYPTDMDLPYRLSTCFGELSVGERITQPRSMDVLLSGTDNQQIDAVFSGTISRQMPVFNSDGEEINPTITLNGSRITSSESCYTALRLNGSVSCYVHTLTMELAKTDDGGAGLSVKNINNHVTAEWTDENGQLQRTTVGVEIPACVEEILEACEGDTLAGEESLMDSAESRLVVYYNTCTGDVIKERVIEVENE